MGPGNTRNWFAVDMNKYGISVGGLILLGGIPDGTVHKVEADTINKKILVDDTVISLSTSYNAGGETRNNLSAYLFNINYSDSINNAYYSSIKLYGPVYIYTSSDDSNLVAELIPAKCNNVSGCTDSTNATIPYNKLGMYDIVRDRFFVNKGSGADFIGGSEV